MDNAKDLYLCYFQGFEFPKWVIEKYEEHDFKSVKVFYYEKDDINDISKLMIEREPCNLGLRRLYYEKLLNEKFGYSKGAYQYSTPEKLMPNIAVYTYATVKLQKGYCKVHVINLIGAAFDTMNQPDYIYYKNKPIEKIVEFYRNMWYFAYLSMTTTTCKNLQIYNVGGGAFAGPFVSDFIMEVFEPAFKSLLPLFKNKGYNIIGYDWNKHTFNGGFIPNCLEDADLENTMFVNAWDPWSIIGNGNERDRSLDGFWGRSSNMSVLGWYKTNTNMKFYKSKLYSQE